MPPRVDVIVNRVAHHLVSDRGTRAALRAAAGARAEVHETRSLADLDDAVCTIARRGTDCVILAGGDGSYMAGTTALFHAFGDAMPPVALAPGGTVSTVARNWGFRGTGASYASAVVRAAIDGTARVARRPTLRVTDDAGGDRIGFIFGAGLVANFFDAYYASPQLGYLAAASLVARVFAGSFWGGRLATRVLTPVPCVLTVDGIEQDPRAWSLIAASVVRDLGLHMLVLHRAAEETARFHAVASALSPRALGPQLPRVLAGKKLLGKDHVDTLAKEMRLALPHANGAYVLDGDVIRARNVRVTPGPVLEHLSV